MKNKKKLILLIFLFVVILLVLTYELLEERGPDHDKQFTVQAKIGEMYAGIGTGRTKKAAQQMAAYQTILKLRQDGNTCT